MKYKIVGTYMDILPKMGYVIKQAQVTLDVSSAKKALIIALRKHKTSYAWDYVKVYKKKGKKWKLLINKSI